MVECEGVNWWGGGVEQHFVTYSHGGVAIFVNALFLHFMCVCKSYITCIIVVIRLQQ